ncbi:cubilin [Chelonus insularis]|uniref:cubilin n=1 Tax=Chelonus insularis TaxID=460826 RepID=UPI00158C1ED3|nr:cubilin [Chelonus insularis]
MELKLLLMILLGVSWCEAWMDERPVLESVDGNLIISSAKDRNITIKILGNGYFNIDDIDLLSVAVSAKSASRIVEQWRSGYLQQLIQKVHDMVDMIEGPYGLQKRVNRLEFGVDTSSNSSAIFSMIKTIIFDFLQVRRLENRLRTISLKLRQNKCLDNPCRNGGTCIRIYDGYQCLCPPQWEGNNCARDINECTRYAGTDLGCQNGASCINLAGSYRCICAPGWYGVDCKSNTASCDHQNSHALCGEHGVCVPSGTTQGYVCICDEGWKSDKNDQACTVDVNECEGKHPPCSVHPFVPCINVPGSYHCGSCPAGFTGNGHYCVDIDECSTDNGGCSTVPKVQCINTHGSRVCGSCPPGYQGDGVTCVFVGTCRINNGGCHPLATCVENPGYTNVLVECRCPEGYHGNGMGPLGCQPGTIVVDQGPCTSNPCVHGTCVPHGQHFICRCEAEYTGTTCNTHVNPCSPNPCKNNGICTASGLKTAICECTAAYTGRLCETPKETCGGVIRDLSGTLTYPASGETYQHGLNCAFILVTNASLVLNVTFTKFDLEPSPRCNDFLQIHDGGNAGSHQLGRFCGKSLPLDGNIVSTHNSLYMWFHTDKSVSHTGFSFHWNSIKPVCGGILREEHGTISSPGSPGRYSPDRDCIWHIYVRPGKRIQFHFFTMMIEEHPTCNMDYLEINETVSDREIQLGLYCNHTHPPPLVTSGSFATVHFHSDKYGQDLGFQLTYSSIEGIPGCGGVYTADQGIISSPMDDSKYKPNMVCEWKIQLPLGERIRLTWITFDIEKSFSCSFDRVSIYEGPDMESPLVGRFCGNNLPPPIEIDSNVALIVFMSDWSTELEGFRIQYEISCGGQYHSPSGLIHSPYYPNIYPGSRTCIYEIIQAPGKGIALEILDMDIEGSSFTDCYFDHLEIRDGDNENSTLLTNLCGNDNNKPSEPIYSTLNYMYLKFETDSSVHGRGFLANYTTFDRRCGGLLKTHSGQIQSPTDSNRYSNDEDCTWTIQAPVGHVVQLTWSSFNLEYHDRCQSDYVKVSEIYDGEDSEIGKYCGTKMPPILTSQSRTMNIVFHTDSTITSNGFIANYLFIDASNVCGGHYFTPIGIIKSPGYPDIYPNNRECIWIIEAPNKFRVFLDIKKFDLEKSTSCNFDYLEIRNGGYDTSPLIGKFCGDEIPEEIQSFTNQLYIKFVSDSSRGHEGFMIEWDSTVYGCGGTLSSANGDIISPYYPQPYTRSSECIWKIAVAAGSRIQILFIDLELEEHSKCRFDYLEIYEGLNRPRKNSNRFCGSDYPTTLNFDSNLVTVRFRSDFTNSGRGFHIKYSTVCSNKIHGFGGVIESPNFPNKYPSHINCSWIIDAPIGNKINVTFSHFDIESNDEDSCKDSYLEIKEGADDEANTELGKFCGSTLPPKIASNQHQIFIEFAGNNYYQSAGFRLEWTLNGCGGHLNRPEGEFTSPGYPSLYPTDITCEWLIEVDYGHSVEIFFSEVNTEKASSCSFDKIEIYGGEDVYAPKLAEFCHSAEPINYTSSTNKMFVVFKSDISYANRGFAARYKAVPLTCGGSFRADQGSIHSANYPMNYPHNQNCEWLIRVDRHHAINLTFTDFDIEDTANCTDDYVEIFDGPSRNDSSLGRFCKNKLPPSIISSGDTLLVVMRTDSLIAAKGFMARFERTCGAKVITDGSGVLETVSNLHLHNPDGINCTWIIEAADPADHVTLTISYLNIGSFFSWDNSCESHFLNVYEGEGTSGPLRGSWCTNKAPPPIVSNGNALTVHLFSYSNSDSMFQASYSVLNSACGGDYFSESGTLASPSYPESYPLNIECVWILHTSAGNRIRVSFSEFDLESSSNCDRDYLEIRQESAIGKLIGVYCGTKIEEITTNTTVWIKFRSDNANTAKGFLGEYNFIHGNNIIGTSGTISSPLYPHPFKSSDEITWRITVEFMSVVRIEFTDFHIENMYGCYYSAFSVHDGYDSDAPLIGTLCGIDLPDPIQSSSNVVFITFNSGDSIREGNWFSLNWYQVPRNSNSKNTKEELSECNEEIYLHDLKNTTFYINSPGFPNGYDENLDCRWTFSSPPGTHLVLWFITLDIEESESCIMDYVEVYSGHAVSSPPPPESVQLGKFCYLNVTNVHVESTNAMTVHFHSDSFINGTGFKAVIYTVCGGALNENDGIIEFNDEIKQNLIHSWSFKCEWNITVRPGRTIEVNVVNMSIDSSDEFCRNYYLLLKNGAGPDSPLLDKGKFCGRTPPGTLMTTGNKLYVKAVGAGLHVNFKLTYREVGLECGGTFIFSDKRRFYDLKTPNYPNIPPPYSECFWTYMAPAGDKLSLHFLERFDLTDSPNCEKEFVEVRDGATDSSKLLGRFCSDTAPSSITSSGNVLYIHFFTNVPDPKNGFKASIIAGEFCGGIIRAKQGVITSPYYPATYPKNEHCNWWIIGPPDHTLKIQFRDIHLPGLRRCENTDYVSIHDKVPNNDTDMTTLGIYCGSTNPGIIETSFNEAFVIFNSGRRSYLNYRGFSLNFTASGDTCGGSLNGMNGDIKSLGYPNPSLRARYCEWRITVPEGWQVRVEIDDLDIGGSSSNDARFYLAFYNDLQSRSQIAVVRTGEYESHISSSTNFMLISFWSSTGHRGLKAQYTAYAPAPCGRIVDDVQGSLTAPSTPPFNQSTFFCQWTVKAPNSLLEESPGSGVTLSVTVSGTIGRYSLQTRTCSYLMKYILVSDSKNPVGMVCGNVTQEPYVIRSPSPSNIVTVLNGTYGSMMKFNMTYKWQKCGGLLSGPSDIIRAPTDITYPKSCAWRVQYPDSGEAIRLTFNRINLGDCKKSYVIVRNGGPMSPEVGKFCGNIKPKNITSSSNKLWIEYWAEMAPSDFEIHLNVDLGGCGGTIRGSNREISSPGFPRNYPAKAECTWEITAENGYHIGLTFVDRFNLESSVLCNNDFVQIFDWDSSNRGSWKSLGKVCGRNVPAPLNTTSNRMKILFRSNDDIQGDGFRAIWDRNCGGIFRATKYRQIIQSPNYPNYYDTNLDCNYTLIAEEGKSILIEFRDFELENVNGNCRYDNLSIYNYEWGWHESSTIWCGLNKPPVLLGGSKIEIIFKTDKFIQKRGFEFVYFLNECGGEITSEEILQPPRSKEALTYFGRFNCTWTIRAPKDKSITLRFKMFELEYTPSCYSDYVSVFEGIGISYATILATLCGNLTESLPVVKSINNTMTIMFFSDDSNHYRGFEAAVLFTKNVASGCGGNINLTNSLSWKSQKGNTYEPFEDCLWTFSVPSSKNIKITFTSMDVRNTLNKSYSENTAPCNGDFLEVRDGKGPFAELIGRYCGHQIPPVITTTRSDLWIRFYSDGEIEGAGATATIEPVDSICGDTLIKITNETKILTSPGYPNKYPLGISCKWVVTSPISNDIQVHLIEVDMEDSEDCLGDNLEIVDKLNNNHISEGFGEDFIFSGKRQQHTIGSRMQYFNPMIAYKWCSQVENYDYYSGSSELEISLKTNMENPHKPRKFKLNIGLATCNRNYTSPQGRIYHQGFTDCWITITVPPGHTISLYFNSMKLFDLTECTSNYLKVHEGDFNGPLLATLCGMQRPSPIFSTTNKLSLYSKSERGVVWESYDITYTSTDKGQGCGGRIYNYVGTFTSPLYPNNYRNESLCTWEVSVPRGYKIVLNFEFFDLGSSDCGSDYISLRDRTTEYVRVIKYCSHDNPAKFYGMTNSVTVKYSTTANNGGNGWVIQFIGVEHSFKEEEEEEEEKEPTYRRMII